MNLLLAAVLLMQDKTAEEIFEIFEKGLSDAKTLSVKLKSQCTALDGTLLSEGSGTILFKQGNRAWIELNSVAHIQKPKMDQPWTLNIISDGAQVFVKAGPSKVPDVRATVLAAPKALNDECSIVFARIGCWTDRFQILASGYPDDFRKQFTLSGFQTSKDEKGRVVLDYQITSNRNADSKAKVELWYDANSLALLRRRNTKADPDASITTETYDEFTLNADIPDEKFKLPEEKK